MIQGLVSFIGLASVFASSLAWGSWTAADAAKVDAEVAKLVPALPATVTAGKSASVAIRIRGKWVYQKHFGAASHESLYDLASLSKVVATTTAALLSFQKGYVKPDDSIEASLPQVYDCLWVTDRLPDLPKESSWPKLDPPDPKICALKSKIQYDHLLRHRSGYRDLVPISAIDFARQKGIDPFALFSGLALRSEPAAEYRYADISMIVLRETLKGVLAPMGLDFDEWVGLEGFRRMGMIRTVPQPGIAQLLKSYPNTRVVPTLSAIPAGQTHDPMAWALGGVAGHAGYFSTLEDLMKFSEFWIQQPSWVDAGHFQSATTATGIPVAEGRGWGWDITSPISDSARGPIQGGFGHTGFTGTSIWIQPGEDFAVLILTNRTYPVETAASAVEIQNLRRAIATIAWTKK
ncbi:MAG: beta-lactamase family protein [Bdellovibrionales bacterium]|nr:beta-lactamase family protein [Bdellovibrionales bacterium]